jgi:hypothetical protein
MTYDLLNIYHNSTSDIRNEIINLWIRNNALNYFQAIERVNYVVYAIREKNTSQIIGVSTAKLNYLPNTQELYYFYGMFIDKNHRGERPWLLKKTYDVLNTQRKIKNIKGLAAFLENSKIPHKLFDRYGWTKFNCDEIENAIFFKNFDN